MLFICKTKIISLNFLFIASVLVYLLLIVQPCSCETEINLGPLYDCTPIHETSLYKFAQKINCQHDMHLSRATVKYFRADVQKYSPQISHLTIYHCAAERLELTCKEGFFGSTSKHRTLNKISVSASACRQALRAHRSPYGPLKL